jgi:hypothetical protein
MLFPDRLALEHQLKEKAVQAAKDVFLYSQHAFMRHP